MKFTPIIFTLFLSFPAAAEPLSGQNAATTLVVLIAIIALILGISRLIKRFQLPNVGSKARIKVVSQLPLGQKERILLLEINGTQLLVGVTANAINLIQQLEPQSINDDEVENGETLNEVESE